MKFFIFQFVLLFVLLAVAYADDDDQSSSSSSECGDNEKWDNCGSMCEPTCEKPKPNPMFCPRIMCTQLTAACRCEKGYVRSKSKGCVKVKEC